MPRPAGGYTKRPSYYQASLRLGLHQRAVGFARASEALPGLLTKVGRGEGVRLLLRAMGTVLASSVALLAHHTVVPG